MISKPNIDLNKPIKSKTVRIIAGIVLAVLIITLGIGIFTNKIDHIWGIGFNTEKKDTLPHPVFYHFPNLKSAPSRQTHYFAQYILKGA